MRLGGYFAITGSRALLFLHSEPICKAVKIVDQKYDKANDHREIRHILYCRKYPQKNEDEIVYSICKSKERTALCTQTNGKETCCHREGAGQKICSTEEFKYEVANHRYGYRKKEYQYKLAFFQATDRNLALFALIGIFQPGQKCNRCHRRRHSEIGQHFSVIGKAKGDIAVKQAEDDHQALTYWISLCNKYK